MTARAHISVKTKVDAAIHQSPSGCILCALCRQPLWASDDRILEHMVPHEFTKDNSVENLRWVHKACADLKTDGPKHLKVDGDKSKIAKAKRLARGPKKSKRPLSQRKDPWRKEFRAKMKERHHGRD